MVKAVLFDMDGVIIDSEPIHYRLSKLYYSELGLDIADEEYYTFVGVGDVEIFTRLKSKYGLKEDLNDLVNTYQQRYLDHLRKQKDAKPISGVDQLIRDLHQKKYLLALGSSAVRENIEAVLESFELREYFNAIASACEVEQSKPFPDIYLLAAEKLAVNPSDCVVIEDSCNGIKAAKLAGMKCIAYHNPNSGDQDLSQADFVITTFEDLDFEGLVRSLEQ